MVVAPSSRLLQSIDARPDVFEIKLGRSTTEKSVFVDIVPVHDMRLLDPPNDTPPDDAEDDDARDVSPLRLLLLPLLLVILDSSSAASLLDASPDRLSARPSATGDSEDM